MEKHHFKNRMASQFGHSIWQVTPPKLRQVTRKSFTFLTQILVEADICFIALLLSVLRLTVILSSISILCWN